MKKIFLTLSFISGILIIGCSSGNNIDTDDPEKAFSIAKKKFERGDYSDAIEDFSFIKVKFPNSKIPDQVQFYLAESYYGQKEYILAAYEYENMLKYFPLSPLVDVTRYKLGCTYFNLSPKPSLDQEFTRYAIIELQQFLELYPTHKYTPDASAKLSELKNKLAYKDFNTAELYVKMDNYKAAALYYSNVYEKFIESEYADDAMIGHAEVLIIMKKNAEARKVLERFKKLFPKSNLKSRAEKLLNSIGI